MRAIAHPPEPGSYRFVLRRCSELDPRFAEIFPCRGEPARHSRNILHADGKRRRTIFVTTPPVRNRAVRLGWEDVTAMFRAQESTIVEEEDPVPSRKPEPLVTAGAVSEEEPPSEESTEPDAAEEAAAKLAKTAQTKRRRSRRAS